MFKNIFSFSTLLTLPVALMSAGCSQNEPVAEIIPEQSSPAEQTTKTSAVFQSDMDADILEGMSIVFEDDFEGDSSIPDQSLWELCPKGDSNWARYLSESYQQAYQKDGYLYLVAEKVDGEYKTAGIQTRSKFEFTYGVVECRARFLRRPQGNHTGIWMMPAPPALQWPKSGEIDIMEHLNKEEKVFETVHSWYADDMGHKDDPSAQGTASIDNEDWNTYGLIWTENEITFTVNGVKHHSYPNLNLGGETGAYQWPFSHPFYLILSQSLGGEGTWAGVIDDSELPAIFQIDWIRVYQDDKKPSSSVPKIFPD